MEKYLDQNDIKRIVDIRHNDLTDKIEHVYKMIDESKSLSDKALGEINILLDDIKTDINHISNYISNLTEYNIHHTEKTLMLMKGLHNAKMLAFTEWVMTIIIMVLLFIYK